MRTTTDYSRESARNGLISVYGNGNVAPDEALDSLAAVIYRNGAPSGARRHVLKARCVVASAVGATLM
jgi:hypothetical protein